MQTLIFLLIVFLIIIFSVPLYFKQKNRRLDKLHKGICPSCHAEPTVIIDKEKNTQFTVKPITTRVLQNHGCSGVTEVEYRCKKCGLKEVHSESGAGCSL